MNRRLIIEVEAIDNGFIVRSHGVQAKEKIEYPPINQFNIGGWQEVYFCVQKYVKGFVQEINKQNKTNE